MNKLTKQNSVVKTLIVAGLFAAGMATTTSANAEAVSLETAIAQTIAAQGQRLINEVSQNVQSNIQQEIDTFSIDAAWQWLTSEETEQVITEQTIEVEEALEDNNQPQLIAANKA